MTDSRINAPGFEWEHKVRGGSIYADGSAIIRPEELDWLDGPLPGLSFKVTFADPNSGDWTATIKLGPNAVFPPHINHSEVHYLVVEGEFVTEFGSLKTQDYMRDPGGYVVERKAGEQGLLLFAKFLNAISAADANGKSTGPVMDVLYIREFAAAHGLGEVLYVPTR